MLQPNNIGFVDFYMTDQSQRNLLERQTYAQKIYVFANNFSDPFICTYVLCSNMHFNMVVKCTLFPPFQIFAIFLLLNSRFILAQGTAKKLTFIVILMTVISILEYVGATIIPKTEFYYKSLEP